MLQGACPPSCTAAWRPQACGWSSRSARARPAAPSPCSGSSSGPRASCGCSSDSTATTATCAPALLGLVLVQRARAQGQSWVSQQGHGASRVAGAPAGRSAGSHGAHSQPARLELAVSPAALTRLQGSDSEAEYLLHEDTHWTATYAQCFLQTLHHEQVGLLRQAPWQRQPTVPALPLGRCTCSCRAGYHKLRLPAMRAAHRQLLQGHAGQVRPLAWLWVVLTACWACTAGRRPGRC